MMKITCDYRERDVIKSLRSIIERKQKNIEVIDDNLSLGDFIVNDTILIERKSLSDLASSIYDGRYREQSDRLMQFRIDNPQMKIFYFIEGNMNLFSPKGNIGIDSIKGAIFSLQYEKDFFVMQTSNVMDTASMLIKYSEKEAKLKSKRDKETNASHSSIDHIKNDAPMIVSKTKSSQINRENIGCLMLTMVPGVSHQSAQFILSQFNNDIYEFLFEIHNDVTILDNLKMNNRKLSKAMIQNIVSLLVRNECLHAVDLSD
jgi:ERCC4-type nuclease